MSFEPAVLISGMYSYIQHAYKKKYVYSRLFTEALFITKNWKQSKHTNLYVT